MLAQEAKTALGSRRKKLLAEIVKAIDPEEINRLRQKIEVVEWRISARAGRT